MEKKITLRVSEDTLKQIQENAKNLGLTTTQYLLCKSVPGYINNILTVNKILDILPLIPKGSSFTLKELFNNSHIYSNELWGNFSTGSRTSTARRFYQLYLENAYELKKQILFTGKNSKNIATYKKL